MTEPQGADRDVEIMAEIRELAARLSDERTQAVVSPTPEQHPGR